VHGADSKAPQRVRAAQVAALKSTTIRRGPYRTRGVAPPLRDTSHSSIENRRVNLAVGNRTGRHGDPAHRRCRNGIGIENPKRTGTLGSGSIHGDHLTPAGRQLLLDRFAAVGVWVFPHGVQRLRRVIHRQAKQRGRIGKFDQMRLYDRTSGSSARLKEADVRTHANPALKDRCTRCCSDS
jgi:hypothetical protein